MKKTISGLIFIIIISFLVLPEIGFCQTLEPNLAASLPLTEKTTENLLDIIRKNALSQANSDLFMESLYGYNQDLLRQTGAVVLVKNSVLSEQLDYWLGKKIQGFSYKFLGVVLQLAKAYIFSDPGAVISVFEQLSSTEAVKYALEKLTSLEVKVASGEISYTFNTIQGARSQAILQYIIVYYPISPEKGFILAEFYSKNPVEPPLGTGTNALVSNSDSTYTNCWPWDRWLEIEKQGNNDGKIEPFIVRVRGYVAKDNFHLFIWDKTKPSPQVEVDFDHPVPEIDQSDIILAQTSQEKTQSFIQNRVIDPLFAKLDLIGKDILDSINGGGKLSNQVTEIKSDATLIWQKIQEFFSQWSPDARISQGLILENQNGSWPSQSAFATLGALELLTDQATKLSSQIPKTANPTTPAPIQPHGQSGFSEIQEILDEIAEQADLLSADLQKLILTETKPLVKLTAATSTDTDIEDEEEDTIFATSTATSTIPQIASSTEAKITFCPIADSGVPKRETIIFNEIAWMGTAQSANDEWIELKNISSNAKTLAGWQIQDQTGKIKIGLTGASLNPNEFYLLERTSDNALPAVLANQVYTGALSNQGDILYLFNHLCQLEDQISATGNWPAGNNTTKQTMERQTDLSWPASNASHSDAGWQTSQSQGGTPKYENSSGESTSSGSGGGNRPAIPPISQPVATSTPNIATSTPPIATTTPIIATSTQPNLINQLVITEIQTQTEEFIEIYNQGMSGVPLSDLFLAYYSAGNDWQNPYRKWRFPATSTIPAQSHFLIGIYGFPENSGNPNSDWQVKNQTEQPYTSQQISNTSGGALGLFSCDPSSATSSALAQNCKIDLASWGFPIVKEGQTASPTPDVGQTLNRIQNQQGQYQDTNENSADFILQSATPFNSLGQTYQPPALPAIIDLTAHPSSQRKAMELFWTANGAKQYLIRASIQEITEQNWDTAQEIPNTLQPQQAGSLEHFKIENLDSSQFWYFAVKTIALNTAVSTVSNSAKAKPLPELQTISNDTMLDPLTQTLWLKTIPNFSTNTSPTALTFENLSGSLFSFNSASSTQNTTNQYNWRAPYFKELSAIANFSKLSPTIDENNFPQTPQDCFWSSGNKFYPASSCAGVCAYPSYTKAQAIDFSSGFLTVYDTQQKNCYLRPVLSQTANPLPFSAFNLDGEPANACDLACSDNNDQTITDDCTGLMWVKSGTDALLPSRPTVAGGAPGDIPWENGMKFCAKLVLCNDGTFLQEDSLLNCNTHNGARYNDWRMPTILENIFAVRTNCPYIFPWASGYNYYYWSSTLSADNKPFGLIQDQQAQTYAFEKTNSLYLQCVRYAN